jgi:aminoglycoside 2'-N-acetyltransferase I
MVTIHTATTDSLDASFRLDLRRFLDAAFDGDFADEDWVHAIGGVHVWLTDASGLISHGSIVERTLVCSGQTLRAGYVEAVATAAAHRCHGYGTTVMRRIGELIQDRYPLGALSTGHHGFYAPLGWERWRGPTFVSGPRGLQRTPDDDGGIMILRTPGSPSLDLEGQIVCSWRPGDVW